MGRIDLGRDRKTLASAGIVALCAFLLLASLKLWPHGDSRPAYQIDAAHAEPGRVELPEATLQFPPLQQYREILARPLFSATRRPAGQKDEPGAGAAPGSPADNLKLLGIVVSPGKSIAIIQDKRNNRVARVPQGGTVAGNVVEDIGQNQVVLRGQGKVIVLTLRSPDKAKQTALYAGARESETHGKR